MNLRNLTDHTLLENTYSLVREERQLLTKLLHHIREIESRRLYSSLKYRSLFEFVAQKLGYPDDQAYRRISAMRLLKELPELEEKINSGEFSLTHLDMARTHFRRETKLGKKSYSKEEKIEVLSAISRRPIREVERILLLRSSVPFEIKPDRIEALTDEIIELRFSADISLQEKIGTLRGLMAHQCPGITLGELFETLCDLGIQNWKSTKIAAPRKRGNVETSAGDHGRLSKMRLAGINLSQAQIRRNVFAKAAHKCENCSSDYALEVDHILPKSMGGPSNDENFRLLCRSCNQRSAIELLGLRKMEKFLEKATT
jgi:hypothetical protein